MTIEERLEKIEKKLDKICAFVDKVNSQDYNDEMDVKNFIVNIIANIVGDGIEDGLKAKIRWNFGNGKK